MGNLFGSRASANKTFVNVLPNFPIYCIATLPTGINDPALNRQIKTQYKLEKK